ncbi:MAG TPA: nuclear transport factor 2 family protein [Solirubrobacter sp.]|nr:nuclear transport factor 2 family protein [Solirubrobacter sp.]
MRGPLVALGAALVVCGCGGGGPSDSERVHAVVEAFGKASAAKDYQRLCDSLLAPKLVEEVESAGLPCELALKQGLGDVTAPKLTIGTIRVDGDSATADVQSTAEGQQPSRDTLQLVRVGGSWRIASLK